METGEIVLSIASTFFAIAFGLWAKRLNDAMDMLESIQKEIHRQAIITERRITRLEEMARHRDRGFFSMEEDDDDDQ